MSLALSFAAMLFLFGLAVYRLGEDAIALIETARARRMAKKFTTFRRLE